MNSTTITNYNKVNDELTIMQQNSSYWYAQLKTKPELGFKSNRVRFSTKCRIGEPNFEDSFNKAVNFAEKKLSEYKVLIKEGHTPSFIKPTVQQIALKVLKEYEKSILDKSGYINIIKNQIIPLLGNIDIKDLGLDEVISFFENRSGGRSQTQTTMTKTAIDDIFIYALRKNMITQVNRPSWKDVKIVINKARKRLAFRETDIDYINSNIDNFIKAANSKTCNENRRLFKYYINFLKRTGTRAGSETTKIKWKHFFEHTLPNENRASIFLEKGKMGEQDKTRTIHISQTTSSLLINLYLRKIPEINAKKFLLKYSSTGAPLDKFMELKQKKSDEYIFARSCGKTPDFCDIWKQFRAFIKTNSLEKFSNENLTLYSFRHYFITQEILKKKDIGQLARYVGNSEYMIRKYYDGSYSAAASESIVIDLTPQNFSIFDKPFFH